MKIKITPTTIGNYIHELPVKTVFTSTDPQYTDLRTYIKTASRWSYAYEQDNRLGGEAYCLETGCIVRFLRDQRTVSILGTATVEE
jgi:hypothetical protein